jgi:hypothetical protein
MKNELQVDLIDGQFSSEDARELLIDLFWQSRSHTCKPDCQTHQ